MLASIRQKLKGFKTLILARVYVAAGGIVALHDIAVPYVAGVDWTPVTSRFPTWATPVLIAATGITFEVLRHATTGPVGHKGDAEPKAEG
jgi:hypothetical protein